MIEEIFGDMGSINAYVDLLFKFDESSSQEYADMCKTWCLINGLTKYEPVFDEKKKQIYDSNTFKPVTLFPSYFPRKEYEFAQSIHRDVQILVHEMANDHEFLKESVKDIIEVDDFTRKCWDIYETVYREGVLQPITMSIVRNDFMLDQNKDHTGSLTTLSQTEVNTLAVGYGPYASKVTDLHKYILSQTSNEKFIEKLPVNNTFNDIAEAMVKTWRLYGVEKSVILFMVTDTIKYVADQKLLEYRCIEIEPRLKFARLTWSEFHQKARLAEDRTLHIDGCGEVALVYFRTALAPEDMTGEKDWDARLMIERSRAIKCPNMNYYLSASKKIQQMLYERPELLNKYIKDPEQCEKIRATFVAQYSYKPGGENVELVKLILEQPEKYVLKAHRDGGGNNMYNEEIRKFYHSLSDKSDLKAYVLMKKITPFIRPSLLVVPGSQTVRAELVFDELSIYGYTISNGKALRENVTSGYYCDTNAWKSENIFDMGVVALTSLYFD